MATVRFYLKPNGTISAKFTLDRKNRLEIKTDERVESKFWDSAKQKVKSNHPHHYEINSYLNKFESDLINQWRQERENGFEAFRLLLKNGVQKKSLGEVYTSFLQAYEMEMDPNTIRRYKSLESHLTKWSELPIENIDHKFYDQLRSHLYEEGQRDSTVYKYIANFKTFLTWALKRGHKVNPSYQDWQVIKRKTESIRLNMNELQSIEALNIGGNLAIARDYLVLNCRLGWRISDCLNFNPTNLHGNRYEYNQKKGNRLKVKKTVIHFEGYCAPALDILEKYNFKMPYLPEKDINLLIKEVCRLAGMTKPLIREYWKGSEKISETKDKCDWITTHIGRKTFINLAIESGVPVAKVAQMLNISPTTVTNNYMGDSEEETIVKYLNQMSA